MSGWSWKGFLITTILSNIGMYIGFYGTEHWLAVLVGLVACGALWYAYAKRQQHAARTYKRQSRPEFK